MFNPPSSDKPCLKCGNITRQTLTPSERGCAWQCNVCKNTLHAYDYKDMVSLVKKHVFGLPDKPAPIEIPNIKVYIKSAVPPDVSSDTELEVDSRAVHQHVAVTGQLPKVGKPMYADRDGMPIPYGEVVRVQEV